MATACASHKAVERDSMRQVARRRKTWNPWRMATRRCEPYKISTAFRIATCGERNAQGQRQWTWQKKIMSPASHTGDTPAWSPSSQSLGRVWWSKRCLVPWRLTIHNLYNVLLNIINMYWYIICLSIIRRFRSKLQLASPQQTGRKCASFVFTRIAQEFRSN